jgi:hypothetical protein
MPAETPSEKVNSSQCHSYNRVWVPKKFLVLMIRHVVSAISRLVTPKIHVNDVFDIYDCIS